MLKSFKHIQIFIKFTNFYVTYFTNFIFLTLKLNLKTRLSNSLFLLIIAIINNKFGNSNIINKKVIKILFNCRKLQVLNDNNLI